MPAFKSLRTLSGYGFTLFMRHVGFAALLLLALFVAMPTAIVWAMNECQLHDNQAAVENCFQGADRAETVWLATVVVASVASITLHLLSSRWKFAALVVLALGPWLTMFV